MIEVQIGSYLEEDDIIRYEDMYARGIKLKELQTHLRCLKPNAIEILREDVSEADSAVVLTSVGKYSLKCRIFENISRVAEVAN